MNQKSALQEAIWKNSESCVLRLLQKGEDLKGRSLGTDLLLLAVQRGACEKIIEHLLKFGAQANLKVLESAFPIYDEIIIEKLLKHGANVKETTYLNANALHVFIRSSKIKSADKSKVCELLIKYGVEVNQQTNCRMTPLFFAVYMHYRNDKSSIFEVLLQYGAQPLLEFDGPSGIGCPLQYIFNLQQHAVETVVKYASLHVNHDDDKSIFEFLAHFRGSKSINKKSKLYFHFATKCLAEVDVLKQHRIMDSGSTLFDFTVSQGNVFCSFLSNENVINQIFRLLSTKSLPIYSEVILRKFERSTIINKIVEFSNLRWSANSQGRKVYMNLYCTEYICKFLDHKNLRNLFIAFALP